MSEWTELTTIVCPVCDGSTQATGEIESKWEGGKLFARYGPVDCHYCRGHGRVRCPVCEGRAELRDVNVTRFGGAAQWIKRPCPNCRSSA